MNQPANQRAEFVIVLRAERGVDDEQATRALRQILKSALRLHGMRCLSAEQSKQQDTTASHTGGESDES
jgi:hypothetical protein